MVCTYNKILFNLTKEWIPKTCYNMMNLKNILLSEISQRPKGKYCVTHMSCLEYANSQAENRIVVTKGSGRG